MSVCSHQGLLNEYKQLASSRESGAHAAVAKAEQEVKKVQVSCEGVSFAVMMAYYPPSGLLHEFKTSTLCSGGDGEGAP